MSSMLNYLFFWIRIFGLVDLAIIQRELSIQLNRQLTIGLKLVVNFATVIGNHCNLIKYLVVSC